MIVFEKPNTQHNPEAQEAKYIIKGNHLDVIFSSYPKNSRRRKDKTPEAPPLETQTLVIGWRIT